MFHVPIDESFGAEIALLPGDPDRVKKIAGFFDNPEFAARGREFEVWPGYLCGKPVLSVSTGIGGPSTAICVEELFSVGVKTFIRIGTCGGMADKVLPGDIVIANAAIRAEGTSREYAPIEFPAVSDFDVSSALKEAAEKLSLRYHIGVVQCKDSFYGQHAPQRMPVSHDLLQKWDAWLKLGTLASEMESAALYTVAASLGARAGCVLGTIWNQELRNKGINSGECHDTTNQIKVAIEAVKILMNKDI